MRALVLLWRYGWLLVAAAAFYMSHLINQDVIEARRVRMLVDDPIAHAACGENAAYKRLDACTVVCMTKHGNRPSKVPVC